MSVEPVRQAGAGLVHEMHEVASIASRMIDFHGKRYMLRQAETIFTGAATFAPDAAYLHGCPLITMLAEPSDGKGPGIALAFAMQPADLRTLAQSMLRRADEFETAANDAAAAALRKAAGK